jgi:hypothetical protein
MRKIRLTDEEHKRLTELFNEAHTTPMIALTTKAALTGQDMATQAWNTYRSFLDALGKKHGYDPSTAKIPFWANEAFEVK